jgi:hypothetical protein
LKGDASCTLGNNCQLDAVMESAANAATSGLGSTSNSNVRIANPPRFDLSSAQSKRDFLNYLDVHGYAVVAAVADEAEVTAAKTRFWSAAKLNADDVLDPDAPDCESRWWLNKQTGACIAHCVFH